MILLSSAVFAVVVLLLFVVLFVVIFKIKFFKAILLGIPSECQTGRIQIKPKVLSDLIWVQSVCKGYQQMTLRGNELIACLWS